MIASIKINPKELTPSMESNKDKFYKKSGKMRKAPSLSSGLSNSSVIEWDDGWAQFRIEEKRLIVKTMFSKENTDFKFEYLYELADKLGLKEICFTTERNPDSWIKLINRAAKKLNKNCKARLVCYAIGIEL